MSQCELLLTGFADEASESKLVAEQFSVVSALGLKYLSLRFIDAGNGIKNAMDLNPDEIGVVQRELKRFDLQVSSLGSPIGKVKLFDFDDGTSNQFFEVDDYLENHVHKACRLAQSFGTKLIRGFSFYHPRGEKPQQYVADAASRLASISEICDEYGLTFGLEVEANLIGQNAEMLTQIHNAVDSNAMVLIFDGANLVTQGFSTAEIVEQFSQMLPALGWIHIKDYSSNTTGEKLDYVDEESLNRFVPAGEGDSDYLTILKMLAENYPAIKSRLDARGIVGVFADLEPHLRQGGQFGGYSGPDGFGVAARAFVALCENASVRCELTTLEEMSNRC